MTGSKKQRRKAFWKMVFNSWDTDEPIIKPANMQRAASMSQLPIHRVGVLSRDCNASSGADEGGWADYIPPERRYFAPVFIRLMVKPQVGKIEFDLVDKQRRPVPDGFVQYDGLMTPAQAKFLAMQRWAEAETARVGEWNKSMATYWARQQLVHSMEADGLLRKGRDNGLSTVLDVDTRRLFRIACASDFAHRSM